MKSSSQHLEQRAQPIAKTSSNVSFKQLFTQLTSGEALHKIKHYIEERIPFQRVHYETGHREIPLHRQHTLLIDERHGQPYVGNSIRTSRYTIYDFIPKQIIFQATRLSNFYFIVIGIPQTIPGFSTTGNFTTILPLIFFMLLTILKEGYDDFRRHRLDKVENKTLTRRYGYGVKKSRIWRRADKRLQEKHGDWHTVTWRDLVVGDVILVKRDEDFPADVILLKTDTEESLAYIETMALDGETNLKPRQAPTCFQDSDITSILTGDSIITVEQPNRDLYNFNGKLSTRASDIPLTTQEVVYRGSTLRNTEYAMSVVINTGEECKIRMNANHHPRAKKPRLESYANQIVMTLIIYVILLSVGCSIGYIIFQAHTEQRSWYLNDASVPFKQIIIGYGIMFNNVIPLALYVSLEIVKIGQVLLVSSDLEMYDEQNGARMRCNTNTILENLGQVSFILSDKTGTLTQNLMKFRGISVGGHAYRTINHTSAQDTNEKTVSVHTVEVTTPQDTDEAFLSFQKHHESIEPISELLKVMQHLPHTAMAKQAHDIILAMAICNTCLPETVNRQASFQASSPDELALVEAASTLGFELVKRTSNILSVREGRVTHEYEILNVIEFSSKRKRMSIILRCPDGRIWLICKGADNMLIPRLKQATLASRRSNDIKRSLDLERSRQRKSMQATHSDRPSITIERIRHSLDPEITRSRADYSGYLTPTSPTVDVAPDSLGQCFQHIENFALDGLRTLLFTHRYVSETEYFDWQKLYQDASTSLEDRQSRMEDAAERLEKSLDLLGATAIEDKLQPGVAETIDKLKRARIRVWMLTGDKRETAINIAHSAKICRPESNIFILDATKGDLQAQLQSAVDEVQQLDSVAVIDGYTLSVIESCKSLTSLFFSITPHIGSVICCRASPAQKAFIVNAIHECVPRALTLAIGDGANDIAMIQAAHVGVGISGKEGMQAARVADYSIAQFSFLQRLLLVHGRWNYVRTAKFVLWTFYKEMFFYMMQALYQQYTGYSGSSLYENWSLTALNTLFTSLCVILPGMFEQDLKADTLLAVPELYVYGQANRGLNLIGYLMWMAGAAVEGFIVWYLPWQLYGKGSKSSDNGAFALGNLMFSLAIMWTNWKLLLIETHAKTKVIIIGFTITVAGWWVWNIFLAGVYSSNLSPFDVKGGLFYTFGKDPNWWLTFVLTLMVLALLDLSVKALRRLLIVNNYWPIWKKNSETRAQERELEAWQELEQQDGFIARLEETDDI